VLAALRDKTHESAQLYRRQGDVRICVANAERPIGLRDSIPVGATMSMQGGSAAQVLLAWEEPAEYWVDWRHRARACWRIIKRLLPVAWGAACGLLSAGEALRLWHGIFMTLDASAGELLAFAMAALGLGAFFAFDLLLRVTRSFFPEVAQTSSLHSRLRDRSAPLSRLLPTHLRSAGSWGPRIVLVVILLAPALVLSASGYLAHNWDRSRPTPVAAPATLPAYPTSFPSQATWTHDIPSVLDATAGAAGPLVLTEDSLISLDPSTGKIRWDYHRRGKKFAQYGARINGVLGEPPYLVTSPDRRHVALTLGELEFQGKSSDGDYGLEPALTIVLDTVTGRVTNEHFHDGKAVQLTDSVLLNGATGYSLTDGSRLWSIDEEEVSTGPGIRPYWGTAGHSTFLLGGVPRSPEGEPDWRGPYATYTLMSDTSPATRRKSAPLVTNGWGKPDINDGWVAAFTQTPTPIDFRTSPTGWAAQAVNLDAMAGVAGADMTTYDLGLTSGTNSAASRATGTLTTLPRRAQGDSVRDAPQSPKYFEGNTAVAAIFDPQTRTVSHSAQEAGILSYAGLARAESGGGGVLSVSSGERTPTTVDVPAGSTYYPPGTRHVWTIEDPSPSSNPLLTTLSTPGTTLVIMATGPDKGSHSFRIFGISGASS